MKYYVIHCKECGRVADSQSRYSRDYLEEGGCIRLLMCDDCYAKMINNRPKREIHSYMSMQNSQNYRYTTCRILPSGLYYNYVSTKIDINA